MLQYRKHFSKAIPKGRESPIRHVVLHLQPVEVRCCIRCCPPLNVVVKFLFRILARLCAGVALRSRRRFRLRLPVWDFAKYLKISGLRCFSIFFTRWNVD